MWNFAWISRLLKCFSWPIVEIQWNTEPNRDAFLNYVHVLPSKMGKPTAFISWTQRHCPAFCSNLTFLFTRVTTLLFCFARQGSFMWDGKIFVFRKGKTTSCKLLVHRTFCSRTRAHFKSCQIIDLLRAGLIFMQCNILNSCTPHTELTSVEHFRYNPHSDYKSFWSCC